MAKKKGKKNAKKRRQQRRRRALLIALALIVIAAGVFVASRLLPPRDGNPRAQVTFAGGKKMTLVLYPASAPESAAAFIDLANSGYYDGLTFTKSGPCLLAEGETLPYTVKGEFADNGYPNPVSHEKGVIGLTRRTGYNSASGGFYLLTEDAPYLNGSNAAFGRVVKGTELLDKLALGQMSPVIETIRVNTYGRTYEYEKHAK